MNLPNALTIMRIVLTPVFLAVFMVPSIPYRFTLALLIYFVASVTDFFDGRIARSRNLVTNFGKFTDPLADKMLTTACFIAFTMTGYCNFWVLFIVLFREFGVSSIRLVASSQGVVIPANMWGKVKTFSMMMFIGFILLLLVLQQDFGVLSDAFPVHTISNVLMWLTAIFTAISGITYVIEGSKVIDFSK